jgi:hypothetical protein
MPLIALLLAFLAPASPYVIRRHDQPDSLFLQLGAKYPALVHINLPTPRAWRTVKGR